MTFTTVGYGDIVPTTAQGKLLAMCTALLGGHARSDLCGDSSSGFDTTAACQKSGMISANLFCSSAQTVECALYTVHDTDVSRLPDDEVIRASQTGCLEVRRIRK
jgi:Ion channel